MTKVLRFTSDHVGQNRFRFLYQGLSQSPLASKLDESQSRRYVALLARFEDASVIDPEYQEVSRIDYVPRVLPDGGGDVLVSQDELAQVVEFTLEMPWVGWLLKHVLAAVDWARTAPQAE